MAHLQFSGELRDTEQAISLWRQKASEFGRPPPAAAVNLSQMNGDGFRFVICADMLVEEDSAFVLYGANFAKLLDLPERPLMNVPMIKQLPKRYHSLFADGCSEAINEAAPVRFSGETEYCGDTELYRATFMPLKMEAPNHRLIYGSFNYCTGQSVGFSEGFQRAQWRPMEVVEGRRLSGQGFVLSV
ncbi:MAG TPA: hypothetical protein VHQ03_00960 [Candidatus Dormibacteraeota bacterium]|nr:hypothetical protein [Candidatus Dormibacteraeota bacterium]